MTLLLKTFLNGCVSLKKITNFTSENNTSSIILILISVAFTKTVTNRLEFFGWYVFQV